MASCPRNFSIVLKEQYVANKLKEDRKKKLIPKKKIHMKKACSFCCVQSGKRKCSLCKVNVLCHRCLATGVIFGENCVVPKCFCNRLLCRECIIVCYGPYCGYARCLSCAPRTMKKRQQEDEGYYCPEHICNKD